MKKYLDFICTNKILAFSFIFPILILYISCSTTLLDQHGFRQTQTAITSLHILDGNSLINIQTPVLGFPWIIPMEYPIYQFFVKILSLITPFGIENSGRILSTLSLYLIIFSLTYLFPLSINNNKILYISILTSPLLLFYSSRFLIEIFAVALSIGAYVLFTKYKESRKFTILISFIIVGSLAGLQKITTYLPVVIGCLLFSIKKNQFIFFELPKIKIYLKDLLVLLISLILPFAWVLYGDFLKNQYYILKFFTSDSLSTWNYGTINQRLDIFNLLKVFGYRLIIAGGLLALFFLALFKNNTTDKFFREGLIWLIIGLIGPIIFFNLYLVHDYYSIASVIFLIVGLFLMTFAHSIKPYNKKLFNIVIPAIFIINLLIFFSIYYPKIGVISESHKDMYSISSIVKQNTLQDDVILILGADWDSTIPYYSNRRALMLPSWPDQSTTPSFNGNKFDPKLVIRFLKNYTDKKNIGAIIFCDIRASSEDKLIFDNFRKLYPDKWKKEGRCEYLIYYNGEKSNVSVDMLTKFYQ